MKKLEIEYPCDWTFKIIGQDEELLRKAAMSSLQSRIYIINKSNASSGGKYISLNLVVTVKDEIDRNEIFNGLQNDSAVKLVL